MHGSLCFGKIASSRISYTAYQCLLRALWLCLLFISLTLSFSFLFCEHTSWGQDQAWALKTGYSTFAELEDYLEVERAPINHLLRVSALFSPHCLLNFLCSFPHLFVLFCHPVLPPISWLLSMRMSKQQIWTFILNHKGKNCILLAAK